MLRKRPLNEAGDTIIEVMVVLAILGLAIGIAYATANRSLLNARQAQESSQAAEVVQSQAEALRVMSTNAAIYTTPSFCLVPSGTSYAIRTNPASCSFGEANRYNVTITKGAGNTFSIVAQWPDILGEGTDRATVIYRMYMPS